MEKDKNKLAKKENILKLEEKYNPKKFIVKITLIQCRNLTLTSGDSPNPYIEVEVADQICKTETIYADGSPKFGKQFIVELIKTKEEFETIKILFRIWHKTKFYYFYDYEIGNYTVDVSTISKKATKMLNNVWGILEHKENPDPGYINYSIVVIEENSKLSGLAAGDFAVNDADADDEEEGEQKKKNNYADLEEGGIPIEMKQFQLTIFIYKGDFAEIPGYTDKTAFKFKVIINQGNPLESSVINGKNPQWKSEVKFSLKLPVYIDNITVEIYSDGEFLSRFLMEFNRLQKDGILDAKWYNLYGPYRQNGFFRKIKYKYKMGSDLEEYFYFGRIFASAKFVGSDNPQTGIKNVSDVPQERKLEYNFWFDIYELIVVDPELQDCEIVIEYQVCTQVIESEKAYYNQKTKKYIWKKEDKRFKRLSIELMDDINQIPNVFVRVKKLGTSIFSSDQYIGYMKFETTKIIQSNTKEVKPTWSRLRKCETKITNSDDNENYLGDILCAFNCFQAVENDINKRPVLYDTKSFKKYKLISIIYMGKNFPLKDESHRIYCEINFYNNNQKNPTITDSITRDANPEWNDVLFITAMLNDGLELSENIKLSAKIERSMLKNELIGFTEIPVVDVDRYNNQNFIEHEVYNKAKWYSLEHPTLNSKCYVLARFMLVRLIKQESEEIVVLKNKKLIPDEKSFFIFLFVIGVRSLLDSVEGGATQVSYNKVPFEIARNNPEGSGIKIGKERFHNNGEANANVFHFNNLDLIQKDNNNYYDALLSEDSNFLKPLYLEVLDQAGFTRFDTFIELDKFVSNESQNLKIDYSESFSPEKKKKKKYELPKQQEDYWPLYKSEKDNLIGQNNEDEKKKLEKLFDKTPINYDESNLNQGDIIELYCADGELVDRKGKKDEDEKAGSFTRPEISGEYEAELSEEKCKFSCEKLRKKDQTDPLNDSEILFVLDMIPVDEDLEKIAAKKNDFKKKVDRFLEIKNKKIAFLCRIYLLNISNITFDDPANKDKAFYWIKRNDFDYAFKQDKKFFDIEEGEINDAVVMSVKWPDTMFLTIEIHIKKLSGTQRIGFTKINLEKRYFNEIYEDKLRKGIKSFRQIPIESRSLIGEEGDNLSKGALRLWVEILEKSRESEFPQEELVTNIKEKYELRVVIWRTRNVPLVEGDKVKIQVKIRINEEGGKDFDDETDVHHNSKDGRGIFNWRFVYNYTFPKKTNTLKLMIYNYNALSDSELLGEKTLDMLSLYKKIHRTKSTIVNDRDWIKLKPQKAEFPDEGGEIELEMKILTFQEADANRVGRGREEPNKDPFLETPTEGRGFLDKFSMIGNVLSGLGGLYDGIFKILKMFGVIVAIGVFAYVVSTLVSVVKN